MKRILHLTLKKKWFDLIASGEKKIEYREYKPYWQKRLLTNTGDARVFDEIHFVNGYSKNSPFMRVKFGRTLFTSDRWCTPSHGEVLSGEVLAIVLGDVLEVVR